HFPLLTSRAIAWPRREKRSASGLSCLLRSGIARPLFAIPFAGERRLDPLLFTRFQVKRVPLGFLDDVLLENLALEAPQRALEGLAFLNSNFRHGNLPF